VNLFAIVLSQQTQVYELPGASFTVKERSCMSALDGSRHLQERSQLFSNPISLTALS